MSLILVLSLSTLGQIPAVTASPAALEVRLVHPEIQGQRLLALFVGARAPSPAAALAAYRRAKKGITGLSKAAEAGIAAINPRMIAELNLLDDATVRVTRTSVGKLAWHALIPHDDETFGSLATALSLTDGASLPPMEGLIVDRLGPVGAPLMAKTAITLLVAGSLEDLSAAVKRSRIPLAAERDSGFFVHLDPSLLSASGASLTSKRLGESLLGRGLTAVEGSVSLDQDVLTARVRGRFLVPPTSQPVIDPKWLDTIPKDDTLAAFAIAIDPSLKAWDDLFVLMDRVDKVDPARASVAPIRLRLGLILRAAKVRPDIDLWPILVGASGFVTVDTAGQVNGVLVRLHAKDEAAATRFARETIPRLVLSLRLKTAKTTGVFGFVAGGRTINVQLRGDSVEMVWGETLAQRSLEASTTLAKSAGPELRDGLSAGVNRLVAFWPGRLKSIAVPEAHPAIWVGRIEGDHSIDLVRWTGLKDLVKRFLDHVPLDPPPDVATPLHPESK